MQKTDLTALLVTGPENGIENLRYLSGFSGSLGAGLITSDRALFFADPRYHIQAKAEATAFELVPVQQKFLTEVCETIKGMGLQKMGVEKTHLLLGQYLQIKEELPDVELVPTENLVEDLRLVKEPEEVELIRAACVVVDRAYAEILPRIKEGVSERDLAIELDFICRRLGAEKMGFDTIVAFGPHSAFPHAHPTDQKLERGQFVKMDFGATLNGYNSDITRTVVFGPATGRHREIYSVVLEAQRLAMETLKPGLTGQQVDAAARDYITAQGFGGNFGHGLGHGLGRDVHDGGALNKISELIIEPGQVWTVEPGVYVEGFGGVRIEDDVVVTETGCDLLTTAPNELVIL